MARGGPGEQWNPGGRGPKELGRPGGRRTSILVSQSVYLLSFLFSVGEEKSVGEKNRMQSPELS